MNTPRPRLASEPRRTPISRFPGALLAAAFAASFASCSSNDAPPKGQLMLAIQTDMALPKDVDTVELQISTYGNVLFDNSYPVGAGNLLIPATFALVEGENPATPVTIRLIARLHGKARVLRQVVTTVPTDRIAMLRVPVQWLCDGSAKETGEAQVESSCGAEQTCSNGVCVDAHVDSSKLPAFEPTKVFGGGTGIGDGTCFDTLACFAQGAAVEVRTSDCTIDLPAGGDANVALVKPPNTDGICGPQACLVPLDASESTGFSEVNGRLALPPAVCDKLNDGSVRAVAVTTACPPKTDATPTCGPWSAVTTSPGTQDAAAPADVNVGPVTDGGVDAGADGDTGDASDLDADVDADVDAGVDADVDADVDASADGDTTDAADAGADVSTDGGLDDGPTDAAAPPFTDGSTVGACSTPVPTSLEAGAATVMTGDWKDPPRDLLLAGSNLFVYTTRTGVWKYAAGDANPTAFVKEPIDPLSVAADATYVYWTSETLGNVMRAPLGGGPAEVFLLGEDTPRDIEVDDTDVYWSVEGDTPGIRKVPTASPEVPYPFSAALGAGDIELIGGYVYVAGSKGINRAEVSNPSAVSTVVDWTIAFALASDGAALYWADDTSIWRADLDGTNASVLADVSGGSVVSVATDGTNVYWVDRIQGTISSVPVIGGSVTPLAVNVIVGALATPDSLAVADGKLFLAGDHMLQSLPATGADAGSLEGVLPLDCSGVRAVGANIIAACEGRVMSLPALGGTPLTLASATYDPQDLATDGTNVYWTNPRLDTINAVPLAGGLVSVLAPASGPPMTRDLGATRLLLDGSSVYFTRGGSLWMAPTSGGAAKAIVPAGTFGSAVFGQLAMDATRIYWTSGSSAPSPVVGFVPKGGGTPTLAFAPTSPPFGLAVDGSGIYWQTADNGISSVPLNGGSVSQLTDCDAPMTIAADDGYLYWQSQSEWIVRMPVGGGQVERLAMGSAETPLRFDATNFYWGTGLGDIASMPK